MALAAAEDCSTARRVPPPDFARTRLVRRSRKIVCKIFDSVVRSLGRRKGRERRQKRWAYAPTLAWHGKLKLDLDSRLDGRRRSNPPEESPGSAGQDGR